ncbi:2-amino-4-hydroxy-6-hydroxymethyldihydropteridine diphosphokinase [Brevibacillus ginsengisoli]|uniref:2-amino-4-hydroxy-6- hydroxymethyldihydropteridine diphosphokinase n=1 Tax=Brevibacillus ginsengisoli TaxID=363854 RepID=UPI003CECE189
MAVHAYLALGSNLGERQDHLQLAINAIHAVPEVTVNALSNVYETDPVGFEDQPAFLNMVIRVETTLPPEELLKRTLAIEQELGRVRTIRWGPRLIDIDILFYDDWQISLPDLQIPHPAMVERAFVLIPLRDLWGDAPLPVFHKPIHHYLENLEEKGVRLWGTFDWGTG